MVNYPKTIFNKLGNNCGYCFLSEGNDEERKNYKVSVKIDLECLIEFFNEKDRDKKEIIEKALDICEKCDYKNPEVFHFLEERGIKFS